MQQAVHQAGAGDLDVVGELEAPLEGAAGDAAMEELAASSVLAGLPVMTSEFSWAVMPMSPSPKPATAMVMR